MIKKLIVMLGLFLCLIPLKVSAADEVPADIQELAEEVGEEFNICPELLEAIAYKESRFDESVQSGNYYGLMQVNVRVHSKRIRDMGYKSKDMFEARPCMRVAAAYLHDLFNQYEEADLVLACYSGSLNTYLKYGYSGYGDYVLGLSWEYEEEHGKHNY